MKAQKAGKRVAAAFLKALEAQWGHLMGAMGSTPTLVMDWDWSDPNGNPSIVWEEGPYDWALMFPYGGVSEETGYRVPDVSHLVPSDWFAEPATGWAVGIYKV